MSTTLKNSNNNIQKRILVTGGNKGIGKAICERLLTEWNDTCVILGSRDKDRGEQAILDILNSAGSASQQLKDRLELLVLDTSDPTSVDEAAKELMSRYSSSSSPLYGIINNAGIAWKEFTAKQMINTNYFGPRRVNDAFGKMLLRPGGRIVNVASASGPNYLQKLADDDEIKKMLSKPWQVTGGIDAIDSLAHTLSESTSDGYGASKALLNAYTCLHSKLEGKNLLINACTPGFIQTDMTAGYSATNPPSKGAIPPCWLMMDTETVPKLPGGRYYGSDCVRSPLHFYRGPGEAPYTDDSDLE